MCTILLTVFFKLHKGPIVEPFKGSIREVYSPLGDPPDSLTLIYFIIVGSLWVREALGNMLPSIVPNYHTRKRPEARDMTIFASHVGSHSIHW